MINTLFLNNPKNFKFKSSNWEGRGRAISLHSVELEKSKETTKNEEVEERKSNSNSQ